MKRAMAAASQNVNGSKLTHNTIDVTHKPVNTGNSNRKLTQEDGEAKSDEEVLSEGESDVTDESDSDEQSDEDEDDGQVQKKQPCKYYNSGGCRDGLACPYLHACRYFLSGNCRYGSRCKLSHAVGGRPSSGTNSRAQADATASNPKLNDGRCYQWQLKDDDGGWRDVKNDHVLEAQYSLPHTKSIKIYNTPYGAFSIDFNRMRVYGKRLKVRRLDDGNTAWIWYCTLKRKWIKYEEKDSKGNPSPAKSSDIERKFQSNPTSSFTFSIGGETFEIRFTEMRQVGKKRKRRVTRRPAFRHKNGPIVAGLQNISLGSKPQWQFEGERGKWHQFKHRKSGSSTECSVTSDDIERNYQRNTRGTMTFTVKGHAYKLDFGTMIQTNVKTMNTRRIRRLLV